ncbi:MAG: hypothetical protein U0L17_07110 [Acutalibacteraceae bacterium]|nr:hypothetical protein [Acutalibacteraceae bacterium]
MIFLYILLGIIALIALILFTGIRIKIEFNENLKIRFYFGFFKIPESFFNKKNKKSDNKSKNKSKKDLKSDKKQSKNAKKSNKLMQNINKKGYYNSLLEVLDFLKPVLSATEDFASKIKINPLIIKVKMTGSDAAKLAIDYGKFCAVYYPLLNLLQSKTNCKNINSNVFVDYVCEENEIYIKTELKIRPIHLVKNGFKIIMEFIKLKDKFN